MFQLLNNLQKFTKGKKIKHVLKNSNTATFFLSPQEDSFIGPSSHQVIGLKVCNLRNVITLFLTKGGRKVTYKNATLFGRYLWRSAQDPPTFALLGASVIFGSLPCCIVSLTSRALLYHISSLIQTDKQIYSVKVYLLHSQQTVRCTKFTLAPTQSWQ